MDTFKTADGRLIGLDKYPSHRYDTIVPHFDVRTQTVTLTFLEDDGKEIEHGTRVELSMQDTMGLAGVVANVLNTLRVPSIEVPRDEPPTPGTVH